MSDSVLIIISLIPALIGIAGFIALKPQTKAQQGKFDSQIVNIKNGKTVQVEFKKHMTESEIKNVMEALKHIKD